MIDGKKCLMQSDTTHCRPTCCRAFVKNNEPGTPPWAQSVAETVYVSRKELIGLAREIPFGQQILREIY
jgi:hypothetical protein